MKRCFIALLVCCALALPAAAAENNDAEAARIALLEESADLLGGLSQEAYAEDMAYFWDVVESSYAFWGIAERAGIDPSALRNAYEEYLPQVGSDIVFINLMAEMAQQFQGIGHMALTMDSASYDMLCGVYESLGAENARMAYLWNILQGERTVAAYDALRSLEAQIYALYGMTAEEAQQMGSANAPSIAMEVLEEGSIAYVAIPSFDQGLIETQWPEIRAFLDEIMDYPHLILDITGNGGGSDAYWQNVVRHLLEEDIVWEQLTLLPSSPYVDAYLDFVFPKETRESLEIVQNLPAFKKKDLTYLHSAAGASTSFAPDGSGFAGKIWLLVDEGVYSSSESFAMFCKDSGFASLVGQQTGGDGGGVDPLLFTLPHSGLAFRFSVLYTLNGDGSNNEETGSTPDYFAQSGESPLEACLRVIAEESS